MQTHDPAMAPLRIAAREAFLYGLPLTEIANVRSSMLGSGVPPGHFFALKGLATPADHFVTTPNVDTIYASTFIDLSGGPATITLPALGERYGSLALMDMYSDHFAILGSRTTGQNGGTYQLVGPNHAAAAGSIRSTTPWVWALARVVVNGPDDVAAALEVLQAFTCDVSPAVGHWAQGASRTGEWDQWFNAANALMLENPPPATDGLALQRMAPLGIGQAGFEAKRFTAEEVEQITAGVADAQSAIKAIGFGGRQVGSWLYPASNTGNFFQDYLNRARIAVSGLAALPPTEATYLAAVPPAGRTFAGEGPWCLSFPTDALPPVDAFWSLTMYEALPDGSLFLTPNAIDRYTIGDRTPGLHYDSDGSLPIWISRSDPGGVRTANWLPAPSTGPFMVILRAYLPRAEITSQAYVPPPLRNV